MIICAAIKDKRKGTILDITTTQQNWLQDRWVEFNLDQRKDCKDMIET